MSVIASPQSKIIELSQAKDPKSALKKAVGDLTDIDLYFNQILVAIYIRPEKTEGGVYLTANALKEDVYQGKVGLVVKKGPMAFVDDHDMQFLGQNVQEGDWVVYRASDGWQCQLNGINCRVVLDRNIRMRIKNPLAIF